MKKLQAELKVLEQGESLTENINQFIQDNLENEDLLINHLVELIENNRCVLSQINQVNRTILLSMVIAEDSYWFVDDENLLVELFSTAQGDEKIQIVKNLKSLNWLNDLHDQMFETIDVFDDEDFYALEDFFKEINEIFLSNPVYFQIEGQKKEQHFTGSQTSIYLNNVPESELHPGAPVEFSVTFDYSVQLPYRDFPIFVGETSGKFRIHNGTAYEESIYAVLQNDEIPFQLNGQGTFTVNGNYKLSSVEEYVFPSIENINLELNKSENVFFENYDDYVIDPFELVEVVFTSNYGSQGYDAHQS
ncbi:MAG: hypothetical protein IPM77_08625, partial [Crocinitomicaceae bacterium]|nr:hypothetical protein [Crocinitomicaceae bacterium]